MIKKTLKYWLPGDLWVQRSAMAGRTCHAAIVARELGIPCVVGTETGTNKIEKDTNVTVSCVGSEQGIVLRGFPRYKAEEISFDEIPETRTHIMLNVGSPENVIIAKEFLKFFDGFSIGSNDLTQTTLGLDRDSAYVSHIYDERNPAVRTLIAQAIKTCKKMGKKVGLCGQAPSDFPDFTGFLVSCGIDSISVTPDVAVKTRLLVAEVEEKILKEKRTL